MDKVALLIAALLILGGLVGAIYPRELIIAHGTWGGRARGGAPTTLAEFVTPAHARFYGLAAIAGGAALAGIIIWAVRTR